MDVVVTTDDDYGPVYSIQYIALPVGGLFKCC